MNRRPFTTTLADVPTVSPRERLKMTPVRQPVLEMNLLRNKSTSIAPAAVYPTSAPGYTVPALPMAPSPVPLEMKASPAVVKASAPRYNVPTPPRTPSPAVVKASAPRYNVPPPPRTPAPAGASTVSFPAINIINNDLPYTTLLAEAKDVHQTIVLDGDTLRIIAE